MIVFVDYEHAESRDQEWAQRNLAARTWITYRLEDLAGMHCMLVRYDRITDELLERLGAKAIFISGQGTPPDRYQPADIKPLADIVRTSGLPIFGFCGGFQFCSEALGSELVPLDVDPDSPQAEKLTRWPSGQLAEFGYHTVDILGDHEILDGLGDAPVFRHAHGLHIPNPPEGFQVLASTEVTPVQLVVDDDRRMVGTQFHPEYWTEEHPAGKTLIANFMRWAEIT